MKARIKQTNEILTIAEYAMVVMDQCDSYGRPLEYKFEDIELISDTQSGDDTPTPINWDRELIELTKSALNGIMTDSEGLQNVFRNSDYSSSTYRDVVANIAVGVAEHTIAKLKEKIEVKQK